jgi:hypothetical protein
MSITALRDRAKQLTHNSLIHQAAALIGGITVGNQLTTPKGFTDSSHIHTNKASGGCD